MSEANPKFEPNSSFGEDDFRAFTITAREYSTLDLEYSAKERGISPREEFNRRMEELGHRVVSPHSSRLRAFAGWLLKGLDLVKFQTDSIDLA
jgi:hypothetical protein